MPIMGLTAEEERLLADDLWRGLAAGRDEEELRGELGLDQQSFSALKAVAFDRGSESLRQRPQEYVYADYLVRQSRCVSELNEMVRAWSRRDEEGRVHISQPAAYVSAVRTKSEIIDRILTTGKEMGMVVVVDGNAVPGLNLKDMSNKEIQGQIVRELRNLDRLSKRFGDADISDGSNEPGVLYLDKRPAS